GAAGDAVQVLLRLGVEAVAGVFEQRAAEAVDSPQRRAEIVRHRIAERLELAVRQHERRLRDAPLAVDPLEARGHLVGVRRERSELVVTRDGDLLAEVARAEAL